MKKKKKKYWPNRKDWKYYKQVLAFAKQYCPSGGSLLDVGGGLGCQYLEWFDWFEKKTIIDRKPVKSDYANTVQADFLTYECEPFDLVLCLQVLEHIPDVGAFAQKLLTTGKIIIVSVPYKWEKGMCKWHVNDPVDEEKLFSWMLRDPTDYAIINDGKLRLVTVYMETE